jgi:trigger factor
MKTEHPMQVTETNSKGLKREFQVIVVAADIERRLMAELSKLSHQVRMPGFRPGKAPVALLKKLHAKNLMGQILEETVNENTRQLMEERKLRPALQPQITVVKFEDGSDLEYTVAVEIIPEIKAPDFSGLKLEKLVVRATDEEVNASLQRLADQQKSFEAAAKTHKAASGDALIMDFLGRIDGVAFDGGAAEDYQLELGSGAFIPGFEDQLIGVKAGDKVDVKVSFPENYGAKPLAGKDAVFEVTVKEVQKPVAVKIDDELAKRMGLEDLEALKKAVREQTEQEYVSLSRTRLKRSLLDALAASHDFEVPSGMVELEFQQIWEQLKRDIERQAAVQSEGGEEGETVEELDDAAAAEYRSIAERRVRLGLLLSEVGVANNIAIRQEEVNRLIAQEARQFPGQEKMVFEFYQKNPQALAQLRAPLYEDKVVDFITEMAKITEKEVSREELLKALEEDEADVASEAKLAKKKVAAKKASEPATEEKPKAKKAAKAAEAEAPATEAAPKKAPAKKETAQKAAAKKAE